MRLDDMANQKPKANRNVKYEKPPKTDSHDAKYHYPSGNGSVSPIQMEKESKTLIDQPGNTRSYHYASGAGKENEVSPIRKMNKYIVGGRVERNRDTVDVTPAQEKSIRGYVTSRIISDVPDTVTGEPRDFVKDYTKDRDLAGSINNNGKPPKVYERFSRPPERLNNQRISTTDDKTAQDGKRKYHYPSGKGDVSPLKPHPLGVLNSNEGKGYEYPSGKGETSPIVGKVLPGRTARRG